MGDIYANATCTIAATAAEDSYDGLFFNRRPSSILPRRLEFDFSFGAAWLEGKDDNFALSGTYLCDYMELAGKCIELAPLNQRAWVSQERQLSRRLLHFTSTQIFWECYENVACETYPERLPDWAQPFWLNDATGLKYRLSNLTEQNEDDTSKSSIPWNRFKVLDYDTYYAWGVYRYQFSGCALTHETDKLVAIQGIASRVSQATGDQFIAGIWRSRVVEELCWFKDIIRPTVKPTQWLAPSWSWANSISLTLFSLLTKFHGNHAGHHIEAEVIDFDVHAKPSGQLESAALRIKCRPLHATFIPTETPDSNEDEDLGSIGIVDQEGSILDLRLSRPIYMATTEFKVDDAGMSESLSGYIVVMHRCLHSHTSEMSRDVNGLENEPGDSHVNCEEEDMDSDIEEYVPMHDRGMVEALFLQRHDEVGNVFERKGLVRFYDSPTVDKILKAHHLADDRVITLV
jgi:hypothetical protein